MHLTPLCTCVVDEVIAIVVTNMRTVKTKQTHVAVKMKTKLTTFLHNSELKEEKVLGEGSFGIVFKGTFRGNDVAMLTEFATCESLGTASK